MNESTTNTLTSAVFALVAGLTLVGAALLVPTDSLFLTAGVFGGAVAFGAAFVGVTGVDVVHFVVGASLTYALAFLVVEFALEPAGPVHVIGHGILLGCGIAGAIAVTRVSGWIRAK